VINLLYIIIFVSNGAFEKDVCEIATSCRLIQKWQMNKCEMCVNDIYNKYKKSLPNDKNFIINYLKSESCQSINKYAKEFGLFECIQK